MKKFAMAAFGGILAGAVVTTQVAGPLVAQEADRKSSVYEQLDLFGDHLRGASGPQYVESVRRRPELMRRSINGLLTFAPRVRIRGVLTADDARRTCGCRLRSESEWPPSGSRGRKRRVGP